MTMVMVMMVTMMIMIIIMIMIVIMIKTMIMIMSMHIVTMNILHLEHHLDNCDQKVSWTKIQVLGPNH